MKEAFKQVLVLFFGCICVGFFAQAISSMVAFGWNIGKAIEYFGRWLAG